MVRLYDRMEKSMHILKYFTQNEWVWTNGNCEALIAAQPESDRKVGHMTVQMTVICHLIKGVLHPRPIL